MTDDIPLVAVLVLVGALIVAPVAAAAPNAGPAEAYSQQDSETPTPGAGDNASIQPGEKLSGVVNVQQAEFEGEVDERTFGVSVARANSNESKAEVVDEQLDDVDQRITELEQRQEDLREARENGSISEGEYRAKMAEVAAELETARRLTNASEATAQGLPADLLAEKGIDATAIQTLKDRAGNLSGPEVAQVAKSIAGEDVGRSLAGAKKPSEVGEQIPDEAGNRSGGPDQGQQGNQDGTDGTQGDASSGDAATAIDDAEQEIQRAQERVDRANETVTEESSAEARAALERAHENRTAARQALQDARDARDNGEDQRAAELADEALAHAQNALEHAQTALDEVQGGAGQGNGNGQGA